jgi:hypothetical protein
MSADASGGTFASMSGAASTPASIIPAVVHAPEMHVPPAPHAP